MLDTLRLTGPADFYRFDYDYEKFIGYRKKDGTEKTTVVMVENKPGLHRVFFHPSRNEIIVECNPHKVIFGDNCYNYEFNPVNINSFVRAVGGLYYRSSSYYVSRFDIGGVQTLESPKQAQNIIDRFRKTRLPGARSEKYKQQNYKSSVFYSSASHSTKIYIKGVEMKLTEDAPPDERYRPGFDLMSTVRAEITYRFRHIEAVTKRQFFADYSSPGETMKMQGYKYLYGAPNQSEAYRGIHIDSFDASYVLRDFFSTFKNWAVFSTAVEDLSEGFTPSMRLLALLDRLGRLDEAEQAGAVSRWSFHRYRAKKKELFSEPSSDSFNLQFFPNLPDDKKKRWEFVKSQGPGRFFAGLEKV